MNRKLSGKILLGGALIFAGLALAYTLAFGAVPQSERANLSAATASNAAAPRPVRVSVDWTKAQGTVTRQNYGLNLYAAANPENFDSKAYAQNLAFMTPGLLRLHNAGNVTDSKGWEGLIDETNRRWDAVKVTKMLRSLLAARGKSALIFNVPNWPAWMDANKDGFLDNDQKDAYARLLADLVRLVNVENKFAVTHWEITNELDGRYYVDFHADNGSGGLKDAARPDRWDEVADIYNRCARAMKMVDPTIKTGGPAAARPDLSAMHERFARATLPNLDFFSFHAYASGSRDTPDADIFDRAIGMGAQAKTVVDLLARVSPKRRVPAFLDEYNISWTWETRDPRMTDHKGAIFDALALVSCVKSGAASALAWNEKDGIYGKTDNANQRRPGADLLRLFNTRLIGTRADATTSDAQTLVTYAVRNGAMKSRSLLLINRSPDPCAASIRFTGGAGMAKPWTLTQIMAKGARESRPLVGGRTGPLPLPPLSVTALTFAE